MNCVESIAEKNVKGVCIEPGEDSFAISKTINGSIMALDVARWGGQKTQRKKRDKRACCRTSMQAALVYPVESRRTLARKSSSNSLVWS